MNISPEEYEEKLLNNEHLPSGLVVDGDLLLWGCTSLTHLPEGLVVEGSLSLWNCTSLTQLPPGLVTEKDLDLENCTSLTQLPPDLVIKGNLDLTCCISLTQLPPGLVVKGKIWCDRALINKIPKEDLPLYLNFNFEDDMHEYLSQRIQGKTP